MRAMLRRSFVQTSGLTALAAARAVGANDRVNLGLIGCGGRGRFVARTLRDANNAAYVAEPMFTVSTAKARGMGRR